MPIGFCFKFTYTNEGVLLWRTPGERNEKVKLDDGATQTQWGIRDNIVLSTIESQTHRAVFHTKESKVVESHGLENNIEIYAGLVTRIHNDENVPHLGKFAITKKAIRLLIDNFNVKFRLKFKSTWVKNPPHFVDRFDIEIPAANFSKSDASVVSNEGLKLHLLENRTDFGTYGTSSRVNSENGINEPFEIVLDFNSDDFDIDELKLVMVSNDGKDFIQSSNVNTSGKVMKKYLDKIIVQNKLHGNDGHSCISGVRFGYDYSLREGTLTLKSLNYFGENEITMIPATRFEYSSVNPAYNRHQYDYWNHYSSVATESSHLNSQEPDVANADASAWALTNITTPLGAKINIKYESDNFNRIGAFYIQNGVQKIHNSIEENGYSGNQIKLDGPSSFSVGDKVRVINKPRNYSFTYVNVTHDRKAWVLYGGWTRNLGEATIVSISADVITVDKPFTFEKEIPLVNDNYGAVRIQDYYVVKLMGKNYGGGHRVSEIVLESGYQTTKQKYTYGQGYTRVLPTGLKRSYDSYPSEVFYSYYMNQLGSSPGVGYDWVEVKSVGIDGRNLDGNVKTYFYTEKEFGLQLNQQSGNNVNPNGYTWEKYDDLTGLIGRQKRIEKYALRENTTGENEGDYYLISKTDFEYRFSDYSINDDGSEKSFFADSDGSIRKVISGINHANEYQTLSNPSTPLGLTSQTWRSTHYLENKIPTINRHNVYLVGTTTTNYSYNRVGQPVGEPHIIKTRVLGFDALSGNSLVNAVYDSKNRSIISESYPANMFYSEMSKKNMISQTTLTKGYILPENVNYWSLGGTSAIKQFLMSSELTTWKDWNLDPQKSVWRQNDQYKAIKIGSAYSEPSPSILNLADEISSPASFDFVSGWQRTSNITRYDDFGHPIEERGLDGNYTSSVYAYKSSLPVAIATNAKHYSGTAGMGNEFSSGDFEDIQGVNGTRRSDHFSLYNEPINRLDSADAHSGVFSVYVKHNSGNYSYSPGGDFLPDDQNRKFQVSCWVKTDNGFGSTGNAYLVIHSANPTSPGIHYPAPAVYLPITDTNGEWKFFSSVLDLGTIRKQYNIPAGTKLSIRVFVEHRHTNKGLYVDDFRFHPVDASVSSFTYDPVTWKVSSITDQNNTTSYFEYDAVGRLITVRDQKKNIVKINRYNYGKK